MARAYICLARNDLADNLLQVLDLTLKPNYVTQAPSISPPRQNEYVTWEPQWDTVAVSGATDIVTTTCYGLAAYLIDTIENQAGNVTLTAAEANAIAAALVSAMAYKQDLTIAAVNVIVALTVAASGIGIGASTATVEEILRILSGEVYKLSALAVLSPGGAHAFSNIAVGGFTSLGATDHRNFRKIAHTSLLTASVATGALSKLINRGFSWINPSFTYAVAGSAMNFAGDHIAADGLNNAVSVYNHLGVNLH